MESGRNRSGVSRKSGEEERYEKDSKEELRHGTWFRKMMVVTVFLFIAMIAAGAAMQMAEWALSGGNGLAAWLVVFGIFAAAVAGCKAYWKPMVRYCRRKYLTVPVVSGLLDGERDRPTSGWRSL